MDTSGVLSMLKVDLGITTASYDQRLTALVASAEEMITREGISLTEELEDVQLLVMYAAWLWRSRDTGDGMPRMLRYTLNNRLFSQKMRS